MGTMVAIWMETLLSAAEISNLLSAVSVVLCFILTVVFIVRFQGLPITPMSVVHVNTSPVQVNFQKIEVPFACCLIKLKDQAKTEIVVKVESNVKFSFHSFWGVNGDNLRHALYLPWLDFESHFDANLIEAIKSEYLGTFDLENPVMKQIISLTVDENLPKLGEPPRSHFPLVILVRRKCTTITDAEYSVGALVSVLHISDAYCPMPTAIIYNYLKLYSGQVSQLQSLYTQRVERDVDGSAVSPLDTEIGDDGACVICRVLQPTRALLPCRHVCVCYLCFPRLDSCPLCRSHFSAFFVTDTGEEEKQIRLRSEEVEANQSLRRHQSFLSNMNGVLNSFLGIH